MTILANVLPPPGLLKVYSPGVGKWRWRVYYDISFARVGKRPIKLCWCWVGGVCAQ